MYKNETTQESNLLDNPHNSPQFKQSYTDQNNQNGEDIDQFGNQNLINFLGKEISEVSGQPSPYATVALRSSSQNLSNEVRKSQVTASTSMATNGVAKKNNYPIKNTVEQNQTNQDGNFSNQINVVGIIGQSLDQNQQNKIGLNIQNQPGIQVLQLEATPSQKMLQQANSLSIKSAFSSQEPFAQIQGADNQNFNQFLVNQQQQNGFKNNNSNFSHSIDSTPITSKPQNQILAPPQRYQQQQRHAQSQSSNQMISNQIQASSRFPPIQKLSTISPLQQYQGIVNNVPTKIDQQNQQASFSFGMEDSGMRQNLTNGSIIGSLISNEQKRQSLMALYNKNGIPASNQVTNAISNQNSNLTKSNFQQQIHMNINNSENANNATKKQDQINLARQRSSGATITAIQNQQKQQSFQKQNNQIEKPPSSQAPSQQNSQTSYQYVQQEIQQLEENKTQTFQNHLQMGGQMMMKSSGQFLNKLNNIQANNNFVSGGVNRYSQFQNRGGSQGQQTTFGSSLGNQNGERVFPGNSYTNQIQQTNQALSNGLTSTNSGIIGQRADQVGLQFGVQGQTYLNRRALQNTPQQLNQIHFQATHPHQKTVVPTINNLGATNSAGGPNQSTFFKDINQINLSATEPRSPKTFAENGGFKVAGYGLGSNHLIGINASLQKSEKTPGKNLNENQYQNQSGSLGFRTNVQYGASNLVNQQFRGASFYAKDQIDNQINNQFYNINAQNMIHGGQSIINDFKGIQNQNGSALDLKNDQVNLQGGKAPNFTIDRPGLFGNQSKQMQMFKETNNNNALLPTSSQVSSTLFIMDCQTFGIFQNQKLLKLENARAMINNDQDQSLKNRSPQKTNIGKLPIDQYAPVSKTDGLQGSKIVQGAENDQENEFTEAQLVNFVIARAQQSTALAYQRAIQQQQQQIAQQSQNGQVKLNSYQNSLAQSIIPKELPKLSEDAKRILNTVKAQHHLHMFHSKVQKLDTLIIELDYYDYKNQLLQQLFHHYGNRVLSNLIHKIIHSPQVMVAQDETQQVNLSQSEMNIHDFQTVDEYIARIRQGQSKKQKKNKTKDPKNNAFSYINDFSSVNEFQQTNNEQTYQNNQQDQLLQQNISNNALENSKKKQDGDNEGNQTTDPQGFNNFIQKKPTKTKSETDQEEEEEVSNQAQNEQEAQNKRKEIDKELTNYLEELQHLFPKYHCKRVDGELTFIDLDHSFSGQSPQKHQKAQNQEQTQLQKKDAQDENKDKLKVKKLNFHVIVKNTRLYKALKFIEEFKRLQGVESNEQFLRDDEGRKDGNQKERIYEDKNEEGDASTIVTKGAQNFGEFRGTIMELDENGQLREIPLSAYNLSSELSQNSSLLPRHLRHLSSFVFTKDCSILKFALYCFHVGIVSSVQQMLRQFFKHVFIVIKPGIRQHPNGNVQMLKELPIIDVEKINKYLIQTKMRKVLQNQKLLGKGDKIALLKRCNFCVSQNIPYCAHITAETVAQYTNPGMFVNGAQQVPGQYSYSALNQGQSSQQNQQPWTNKFRGGVIQQNKNGGANGQGENDFLLRNFSLTSFKSIQDLNRSEQAMLQDYQLHFNSGSSTTKVEGPAISEKTTLTIFHKPYTHLDNSRIQKCFKIYNEFIQLVFKSRLHMVQNPDNFYHQGSDIGGKGELTRIYKLAGHMGIKLPRRAAGSSLARQPLVEMLKNQRSVGQIKEQMVRFVHRILNEENGISMKFVNTILMNTVSTNPSAVLSNVGKLQAELIASGLTTSAANLVSGSGGGKEQLSPLKNQNPETHPFIDLNRLAIQVPNNQKRILKGVTETNQQDKTLNKQQQILPQIQKIKPFYLPGQPTSVFKHQVGLGNNHPLIKSLMKQRLWWHHIQPKNSMGQGMNNMGGTSGGGQYFVMKIDFEEAQIMWTQWRKLKLYDLMIQSEKFKADFKDLLAAIDNKYILIQTANGASGQADQNQGKGEKSRNDKNNNTLTTGAAVLAAMVKQDSHQPCEDKIENTKNEDQTGNNYISQNEVQSGSKPTRVKLNRLKSTQRNQNTSIAKGTQLESANVNERVATSDFKQFQSKQKGSRRKQRNNQADDQDDDVSSENDRAASKDQKSKSQLKGTKSEQADQSPSKPKTDVKLLSLQELKNMIDRCKKQFQKIYNRLEFNQHLNNKKALFFNMRNYYNYCCSDPLPDGSQPQNLVFNTLPLTFHIKTGLNDPSISQFEQYYQKFQSQPNASQRNIWIIKPGENSNRGNGIKVEQELSKIRQLVTQYCYDEAHTVILQKYIDNPLLYQRRKFDFRCFALITCHNGIMKAYFYRDGYIRTSSKEFSMNNLYNKYVHLVNDAVQKYGEDYGKYEPGNKLTYCELQKYFTQTYPEKKINLERDIIIQIKKIVTDTIRATFHLLDAKKRLNSFELFGYDFMFDDDFRPYLIEVNSNPSLEPSNNALVKLFTHMLDNTFRIAIEPLFPPSEGFSLKKGSIGVETCPENRFDLIFDERIDGPDLLKKFQKIGKKELQELEMINELEGSEDEQEAEVGEVEAGVNEIENQIDDVQEMEGTELPI